MTIKVQLSQSLRVANAALITHLDSFKNTAHAFRYDFWKDTIGIHRFYLHVIEDGYEGNYTNSNLGSISLRSLGPRLTGMVMEDSVWLNRGPNLARDLLDIEAKVNTKERKASYQRIQTTHQEVRDYVIEALQEDRLIDGSVPKRKGSAKRAGCTFEKSFVYHILTQLLIHFSTDLGFHPEVRGCILDFCDEHSRMIKGMKRMRLPKLFEKPRERRVEEGNAGDTRQSSSGLD